MHYDKAKLAEASGQWTLLHELSHAKLSHTDYRSDLELLMCEAAAWDQAVKLSQELNIKIDPQHIESCLDTYRDWLYARSTCPTCELNGLQKTPRQYLCLNCLTEWQVSPSRFCRAYRMQKPDNKKTPSEANQTVFG